MCAPFAYVQFIIDVTKQRLRHLAAFTRTVRKNGRCLHIFYVLARSLWVQLYILFTGTLNHKKLPKLKKQALTSGTCANYSEGDFLLWCLEATALIRLQLDI